MEENNLKGHIVRLLGKRPDGMTILDISNSLNVSRHTISKYIFHLTEVGVIRQHEIGRAKVCVLAKRGKG